MNRKIDLLLKRLFLFVCLLTMSVFVSASSYSISTKIDSEKENTVVSSNSNHILLHTFKSNQAPSFYTTFSSLFVTKQLIKSSFCTANSSEEFSNENKDVGRFTDCEYLIQSRKKDFLYPFHYHW